MENEKYDLPYCYTVSKLRLEAVFEFIRSSDDMGGWKFEGVILESGQKDCVLLVLTRKHKYPYVENQLERLIKTGSQWG